MIVRGIKALFFFIKYISIKFTNRNSVHFSGIGRISLNTIIYTKNGGEIWLYGRNQILELCKITSDKGKLIIGENSDFNRNCIVCCHNSIKIGKGTIFGPNCCIYDHDHLVRNGKAEKDKYITGEIVIGDNCWIGAGVIILKNTYIGDNCIIGAGTVVKGKVENNSILKQGRNYKFGDVNRYENYYKGKR